jgi:hypothetical protein
MGRVSRRQALAGFGNVSLAALLAACNDDEESATDAKTHQATNVEPKSSTGNLAARFDEAAKCSRTAELSEGPFYFDVDRIRSDIREGREGATLSLGVRVTLSKERDSYLGLITLDVARA